MAVLALVGVTEAAAKGPGSTYCFYKTCHRVKTIAETQALVGHDLKIVASHYDSCSKDRFNPCGLTSSGERFAPERADNAASPILPDGTIALVWSKRTQEAVVIRINNAGPYWGNRKLDLSRAAARRLGIGGVGEVTLRVLKAPTPAEARYVKNRRYAPVPGPIGQFASLDAAHTATALLAAQSAPTAIALAGLEEPSAPTQAADAFVGVASAYRTPVVPGFVVPKGALAQALIAQTAIEQRVVTATVPPVTDLMAEQQMQLAANVEAVTPKLVAVKPVSPKPLRVKAIEVRKPADPDVIGAMVGLVESLISPVTTAPTPKAVKKRTVAVARTAPKRQQASKAVAQAVGPAANSVKTVKVEPPGEYRAGFTTYQEDRYHRPTRIASAAIVSKPSPAAKQASGKPGSVNATAGKAGPTKQAANGKPKKQAALKKGEWQSSAVIDVQPAHTGLTGEHPRIPADSLKDEPQLDRQQLRRVHPSALV